MIRATLSAVLIAAALGAGPLPGQAQTVPQVPEQVFTNDPSHTSVDFAVSHLGFSTYRGSFDDVAITLTLDTAKPESASLRATVDTGSLRVPNPPEGFLDTLLGPDWFHHGKFPEATFVSGKVVKTGPTTADIEGTLTLHGVSAPLTLSARFNGGYDRHPLEPRPRLGFSATATFKRSDFGMAFFVPPPGDTFGIGDEITLSIEAEMLGALLENPQ